MRTSSQRASFSRFRDKGQKVYVPTDARDNHYVLANFVLPQALIETIKVEHTTPNMAEVMGFVANKLFRLCQQHSVENVALITKDKLVRVRYASENETIETNEQLIFYYNPEQQSGFRRFIDKDATEKVQLLFLAEGEEIRDDAVRFHKQISQLLKEFAKECHIEANDIKVKDHQHITFDVLNRQNKSGSKAHGFRELSLRYQEQGFELPAPQNSQSFLVAKLPTSHFSAQLSEVDYFSEAPFKAIYDNIAEQFKACLVDKMACQSAMLTNDKIPVIRFSQGEMEEKHQELCFMTFGQEGDTSCKVVADNDVLPNYLYFVFAARNEDQVKGGYAKFVNSAISVLQALMSKLELETDKQELVVRFYQHLSYRLLP